MPVHPGAAAYLDGELKTFFDRYSDLLYWGLMVVSFFGSGFAGLLSYSKARRPRPQAAGRWNGCWRSPRRPAPPNSIQALDDLQAEIDDIQADMIREVEANALDETAMMAYAMSLERAQLAISDRRATLLGQPPRPLAAVASAVIRSLYCAATAPCSAPPRATRPAFAISEPS